MPKISALPGGTLPVAGTSLIPIVQGGVTKQVTVADIRNTPEPFSMTTQASAQTNSSTGTVKFYSRNYAGRPIPEWIGPEGGDAFCQAALYNNMQVYWGPATGTTAGTSWGASFTPSGTITNPAQATTNFGTSMRRVNFASATTAGSTAGTRSTMAQVWRGNAAGLGGFFCFFRFSQATNTAATQAFIGLAATLNALAGEPSALTDMVGIGYDSTDSTATGWQVMYNDASGAATKVTLTGAPRDTTTVLDLTVFSPPNGSYIGVRVFNQSTNSVVLDNATYTTNIPTNTAFLALHAQLRNGALTSAVTLNLAKIYAESDY